MCRRKFRTPLTTKHRCSWARTPFYSARSHWERLIAPIDRQVASRLQDSATQENRFLSTAATGLRLLGDPGSLATGAVLYGIGRADGQRRVQALGLHSVESIVLAGILS